MLTVAFDNQTFLSEYYGGVAEYFVRLAQGLAQLDQVHPVFCGGLYRNYNLRALRGQGVEIRGLWLPHVPRKFRGQKYSESLCARQLRAVQPDIIHETNYAFNPPGLDLKAHRVLTVYDMIHEKFMPDTATPALKRAAIARAEWIFCISETTRNDLLEYYPEVAARTSVTYLAGPEPAGPLPRPANLPEPYILYVGNRAGYKNFATLLRAYAQAPQLHRQVRLAVYGGKPWSADELSSLAELGIAQRVTILPGSAPRTALYQHAEAFVFPSRYEGFGIPLLEAAAEGCPIVCSDTPCFREVAGDCATYFDPAEPESIATAIARAIKSKSVLAGAAMALLGQKYNWRKCSTATYESYRAVSLNHSNTQALQGV